MSRSKQLNFFVLPEELKLISTFFEKNGCLLVEKEVHKNPILLDVNINSDEKKRYQICVTKEQFRIKINMDYVQTQDNYYIDILSSYAIEFSLGGFYPYSDRELHRSRLYLITEYYKEGELIKKSPEFVEWGGDLLRDLRKQFLVKSALSSLAYFSEQFLEWVDINNAKLEQGGLKFSLPAPNSASM